mgnify:CR=1 FL=1
MCYSRCWWRGWHIKSSQTLIQNSTDKSLSFKILVSCCKFDYSYDKLVVFPLCKCGQLLFFTVLRHTGCFAVICLCMIFGCYLPSNNLVHFFVIFYFVCCGCHLIHHHKTYVHIFGTLCQSQCNRCCFQSLIVGIYSDFILLESLRWHYCSVSAILKVIARLLNKSKPCAELDDVRKLFLDDLICLCENNEDNRRWDNFTV